VDTYEKELSSEEYRFDAMDGLARRFTQSECLYRPVSVNTRNHARTSDLRCLVCKLDSEENKLVAQLNMMHPTFQMLR